MLGLQDLTERLLRLDEDAYLSSKDENKYSCVIVGGGALILMGYITRATHDIDVISFAPQDLILLMDKYDISTSVSAYMDSFPEDYIERIKKVDLKTRKIDFYTLSIEDLVISKLSASREKDIQDITSDVVLSEINWDQLTHLAEELKLSLLSDRLVGEFENNYNEFIERYKR
jgi:hypothetical protein